MIINPGYWPTTYWSDRYWTADYWPEFAPVFPAVEEVYIHPSRKGVLPAWTPPPFIVPQFVPAFMHGKTMIIIPVTDISDIDNKPIEHMNQKEYERWRKSQGAKHH